VKLLFPLLNVSNYLFIFERLWHEEQFGPVIPIAVYNEIEEVYDYIAKTPYGQQAAVFTTQSSSSGKLLDYLATVVGRVNVNTQCGRSPDSLPFSGRRSSGFNKISNYEVFLKINNK
jgi:glyceraldehyde-3-phosphate dehydrogenase (NADP+)